MQAARAMTVSHALYSNHLARFSAQRQLVLAGRGPPAQPLNWEIDLIDGHCAAAIGLADEMAFFPLRRVLQDSKVRQVEGPSYGPIKSGTAR